MTPPSHPLATAALFVLTAVMEIVGCFLPTLWLRGRAGSGVLLPAALALAAFVALLALYPMASGRVYAAYGGVYVATAIDWPWLVDGVRPTAWHIAGTAVALTGMLIIVWGWRQGSGSSSDSVLQRTPDKRMQLSFLIF